MKLLLRWLLSALALFITVLIGRALGLKFWIAPGLAGVEGVFLTVLVLGIVNATLRPLLKLLTLPLSCLTFGLFAFVINAIMFWLAGQVQPEKFHVRGLTAALFGSIVMSIVSGILNMIVISDREKKRNG